MIITGKIKKLVIGVNNPYGFILSDGNIKGQTKDPVFWENDVIDCLFSDLSVGDIVQFDAVEWVDRNGDIQIIARQVKSRMSGVIKFIKINKFNQLSFCGYIQPDKNWLGHMIDIGFFSDSFKNNTLHNFIDYCNSSFDSKYLYKFINGIRVDFSVQEWKSNNPDITKVAKKIKLVDAKLNQLPVNKSSTKLLKDKITYFLDRIEGVSDPYEFEDLVFTLLRLIGINKIYKYDRGNAAGKADGVFVLGNRSVIYDCTLNTKFTEDKDVQILNYKNQLRSASSITINEIRSSGKAIKKTFVIPEDREIWIITRGETRIIEKPDSTYNICVREVSIKSLIDVFNQKLDSKIYGKLNIN